MLVKLFSLIQARAPVSVLLWCLCWLRLCPSPSVLCAPARLFTIHKVFVAEADALAGQCSLCAQNNGSVALVNVSCRSDSSVTLFSDFLSLEATTKSKPDRHSPFVCRCSLREFDWACGSLSEFRKLSVATVSIWMQNFNLFLTIYKLNAERLV